MNSNTQSFTINYNYYESYQGPDQKSGAYIFRPAKDDKQTYSNIKTIYYAEGVKSVVIVLDGDRTDSKVTFSKEDGYIDSNGFEIETHIDSIPVLDKIGKEVTLNFAATGFLNNDTFYTDSNGL